MAALAESLIETLSLEESANVPVMGTLAEQIVYLLNPGTFLQGHDHSPEQPDHAAPAGRGVGCAGHRLDHCEGFFHFLKPNPDLARLIEARNMGGVRRLLDRLDRDPSSGSHAMNSDLRQLLKQKKISLEDACKISTDRTGLVEGTM